MIECVPNFSEGRDRDVIGSIVAAIQSSLGAHVLGWEMDSDHNRSVVTFAGPVDAVIEAAVRAAGKAAEKINLTAHAGVHPRVGAADVIPFVPLEGSSIAECVDAAHQAGREIWGRHRVPVYFYEAAALSHGRRHLQNVRRAEFDGQPPDIGDVTVHPTAGASMVGARNILIAYNVLLDTPDIRVAKAIARVIREANGGFKFVKSIGLYLESQDRAQVSMNLTHFAATPLDDVYEAIAREAQRLGTRTLSGEIIGFIPRRAYQQAPRFFERAANFDRTRIIENRLGIE